jgi:predicted signal transduction protein with EAL and GGDEF domain
MHGRDESGWSLDDGWRKKADGTRFWGNAMIYPLRVRTQGLPIDAVMVAEQQAGAPAYCLVIRDITDKREASEKIRKSTACDHLTGIANRRTFFEAAELELARWKRLPRPLSLVLFDAVSGGAATMNATVTGLEDMIRRADQALYVAKDSGRNRVASCNSA